MDLSIPILSDFLVLFLFGLLLLCVYRRCFHPLASFPGPFWGGITPLYSLYIYLTGNEHEIMYRLHQVYGPVMRWQPNLLVISDARYLPIIYHSQADKTPYYNLSQGLGYESALDIRKHQDHSARRRRIAHAFAPMFFKDSEPFVAEKVTNWTNKLEEFAIRHEPFDIAQWAQRLIYDVGTEVIFGNASQIHDSASAPDALLDTLEAVLHGHFALCRLPNLKSFLTATPLAKLFLPRPTQNHGAGLILKECKKLVTTRFAEQDKPRRHRDMFDYLFYSRKWKRTEREMALRVGEITTFVVAHADTIPRSFRHLVMAILSDPDIHQKVVTEINHAIAAGSISSPVVKFEEAKRLPYLNACVQESFRVHSTVRSYLPRYTPRDGLHVGGHYVPPGAEVGCCPWVVHRDKEFFGNDADVFRPERWLQGPENIRRLNKYNLNFGGGTRICLGRQLSLFETFIYTFELFRRFDATLVEIQPMVGRHEGLMVKVEKKHVKEA